RIRRVEENRVQAHATGSGLPLRSCSVTAQPGQLVPRLASIGRAEDCCVFHTCVGGVGVVERRLHVPDALELPRMLRTVVPLVRGKRLAVLFGSVVDELIALAFGHAVARGQLLRRTSWSGPRLASVVRSRNDLPEPPARLRNEYSVG